MQLLDNIIYINDIASNIEKKTASRKEIFIYSATSDTNNAFNNRSSSIEITEVSVCLSRIRLHHDIPVARLNGLNGPVLIFAMVGRLLWK